MICVFSAVAERRFETVVGVLVSRLSRPTVCLTYWELLAERALVGPRRVSEGVFKMSAHATPSRVVAPPSAEQVAASSTRNPFAQQQGPQAYILASVVGVRNVPSLGGTEGGAGGSPKTQVFGGENAGTKVMVTCSEYGMKVGVPSQPIKLLVSRGGSSASDHRADAEPPALTFSFSAVGGVSYVAKLAVADLEPTHGVVRDIWAPLRVESDGTEGDITASHGAEASRVPAGHQLSCETSAAIRVILQYFTERDVAAHSAQTSARIEQAFRRRTSDAISKLGGSGGESLSGHASHPSRTPEGTTRALGSSATRHVARTSPDMASLHNISGIESVRSDENGDFFDAGADGAAGPQLPGEDADPGWRRAEPYRKIIATLEQKLDAVQREESGWRDRVASMRKRNKETTDLYDQAADKYAAQILQIRKDYDV